MAGQRRPCWASVSAVRRNKKHPQNHGAWCNGNARFGEYTEEMENTKAVA